MRENFILKLLFSFFLILFMSCQQDDSKTGQSEENIYDYGLKEKFISYNDLQNMPEALKIVNSIKEKRVSDKNERVVYDSIYDFFINTDRILMMENGRYHSLTFPIFRLPDNNFTENLVLSLQDDDTYTAAIYTYKLTPTEKAAIENDRPTKLSNELFRTVLPDFDSNILSRMTQIWLTEISVIPCSSGQHHAGNMGSWGGCIANSGPQIVVTTRSVIIDDGGMDGWIVGGDYFGGGDAGPTGGSGFPYDPNIPPFNPSQDMALVKGQLTKPVVNNSQPTNEQNFFNNLTYNQQQILQQQAVRVPLLQYLENNEYSEDSIEFATAILDHFAITWDSDFPEWAFNFLANNPDTTLEEFDNWFLTQPEGNDGEYDARFWEDPNLTFPQQVLPTFQEYLNAYPKHQTGNEITNMTSSEVYQLVGGSIYSNHLSGNLNYQNACSIRGSRALNYSGVNIGVVMQNGIQRTEKGSDNKNYILAAAAFNVWMNKTFGPPTYKLTNAQINGNLENVANFLKNKSGIYTLVTNSPGQAGYSGHVDIILSGICLGGANANPNGGIKYIEIWELD